VWHVLDVLQVIVDAIDLAFHWRVWACAVGGLVIALLLLRFLPSYVGSWGLLAGLVTGLIVGLFWEWQR
jgi:hypothetical protein